LDDPYNLRRFIDAQDRAFDIAMSELRAGSKQSHWMWFIFPQLAGLGHSPTAQYYGISSIEEARAYLHHPVLGPRLRQGVEALLPSAGHLTAEEILGTIDALKFKSSLTLFDEIEPDGIFADGLDSFYGSTRDERTLALLNAGR
jgi:uncharacterized protein (DUF1810 family)